MLNIFVELNHRIYVQDGQTWSARGRFAHALGDDKPISWQEQDGGLVLPLAFDSDMDGPQVPIAGPSHVQINPALAAPAPSVSSAPTPAPTSTSDASGSRKHYLATLFNIPLDLMDRTDGSLHRCYQRYLAWEQADKQIRDMEAAGTLPCKKPSKSEMVEIFVSKSKWFSDYAKTFPHFKKKFPTMKLWLESGPDAPTDLEAWGVVQDEYVFSDLLAYIERGGPVMGERAQKRRNLREEEEEDSEEEEDVVQKKRKGKRKEDNSRDKRRKGSSPYKK